MLDHTTLRDLAFSLAGLFWRDLERHHPGIRSLNLSPEVAAAWKQRVLIKTRQVAGPDGQISAVQERRAGGLHNLAAVRAFYLDIAQWAMEDPARWAPWAAPCPIRAEDLARQKEIRARKSRMDQRTRERLPVLPVLVARVNDMRTMTAARLATAQATAAAGTARIWVVDPSTGKRRDLTGEEDRAFWTWAAVETLRHTGIRIEELTELSHHSLIHYTLPGTDEPVPLLQIAPSKTDTERLLVISPELADVLAAVIHRIRNRDGALGCVVSYDSHERVWNPPMPLLFQRRFGIEHRAIPAATLREWISGAFEAPTSPTPPGSRCGSPRTTSAACSSPTPSCTACPRTSPNSSPDTATSTPPWATRPSTPTRSSTGTGRSSPAAARCAPAPNTGSRPSRNGSSSSATSNTANSPSAPAAAPTPPPASTNTPACAARCYAPTPPNAPG